MNAIVSLPLVLNLTFLPPSLTEMPLASVLAFLAKVSPLGSEIDTDFSGAEPLGAASVNVSLGLRLPIPFSETPLALVTGGLTTFQVNETEPAFVNRSWALTVTVDVPEVVGMPEMTPLPELMLSPAGRPLAP